MDKAIDLVLFGGTGDLTLRKLLPALYRAYTEESLPQDLNIFATCRAEKQKTDYLLNAESALKNFLNASELDKDKVSSFLSRIHPVIVDINNTDEGWVDLRDSISTGVSDRSREQIYYFAIAPSLFSTCCRQLDQNNLIGPNSRVVLEKPIGYDQFSAEEINTSVAKYFSEEQTFRIDHYLGKETVQNLMILRFSNLLFENMWDRNSIDHIQISLNETVGLEGRAGFYDDAGALRDMVQNHLLQLLCLVAMEPPNQNNSDNIRAEKIKVLRSLRPIEESSIKQNTVRGQYVTGESNGELVSGYLEELSSPESFCETFVAIRAFVDNWRWKDVPFYLRTGKRLKQRVAEIVVQFKPVTHSIYSQSAGNAIPNKLVIQLQPEEKIQLHLNSKDLGKSEIKLQPAILDLNLTGNFKHFYSDAYKRLLLDVINDDASLFIHRDEVKSAWGWIDPIIESWQQANYQPELYRSGSWGPQSSSELLNQDGRHWHVTTEDSSNG